MFRARTLLKPPEIRRVNQLQMKCSWRATGTWVSGWCIRRSFWLAKARAAAVDCFQRVILLWSDQLTQDSLKTGSSINIWHTYAELRQCRIMTKGASIIACQAVKLHTWSSVNGASGQTGHIPVCEEGASPGMAFPAAGSLQLQKHAQLTACM